MSGAPWKLMLVLLDPVLSTEFSGYLCLNSDAVADATLYLPPWGQSLYYDFVNDSAFAMTLQAAGADRFRINGQTGIPGGNLKTTVYGTMRLTAYKAGLWLASLYGGEWSLT